jgi:hypothetical protein
MVSFGFKIIVKLFSMQIFIVNYIRAFTAKSEQIAPNLIGLVIIYKSLV